MQILRQSTEVIVRVGPFVDVGDGFTPQTDIALSGNEAELLKNASVEVDISGNTWAAVTNCRGWYDLTLSASDTDTVGLLTVVVQDDSDCLPVFRDLQVVAANVYDSLFAAADTDHLRTNVAFKTTIASVTTADTVFVLTDGPTDDNAQRFQTMEIEDVSSGDKRSRNITSYVAGTKTITVDYDYEFPLAAGDIVTIYSNSYSQTAGAAAAGEIADAVWDEADADHMTQGTKGLKMHHAGRGRY